MYKTKVKPEKVLVWEHEKTTSDLEEIAKRDGFEDLPALVFKTPWDYRRFGEYVLFDGHHRREAAKRQGVDFYVIVIEKPLDFKEIPGYEWTNLDKMSDGEFREFIEKYVREHFKYERRRADYWDNLDFHPF